MGERYWGGYTQRARVKSNWLVPLPEGLDTRHAMAIGTAGFTAMLCVMTLEEAGIKPGTGPSSSRALPGVGSVAVAILSNLGFRVAALTPPGQEHADGYLQKLGATDLIGGPEWGEMPRPSGKPALERRRRYGREQFSPRAVRDQLRGMRCELRHGRGIRSARRRSCPSFSGT